MTFFCNFVTMAYDIENTFNQILLSIEEGNSLRATLKREGMPDSTTFYSWIDKDEAKVIHYARACEKRADAIFEDIIDIADNTEHDTIITEKGEIPNTEWIQRSKLKVDARKWILGKMNPKKYGDKIQQELSGGVTQTIISLGSGIKPDEATD